MKYIVSFKVFHSSDDGSVTCLETISKVFYYTNTFKEMSDWIESKKKIFGGKVGDISIVFGD